MDDNKEDGLLCEAFDILAHVIFRSLSHLGDNFYATEIIPNSNSGLASFLPVIEFLFIVGLIAVAARNDHVQRFWFILGRLGRRAARRVRSAAVALAIAAGPVRKAELLHLQMHNPGSSWDLRSPSGTSACYALQGRRPKMEDRFTLLEKLGTTPIQLYAVYDGHGGEFAADYAQKWIVQWLEKRMSAQKYKIGCVPVSSATVEHITDAEGVPETGPNKNSKQENIPQQLCTESGDTVKTSNSTRRSSISECSSETSSKLSKTPSVRRKFYFSGQEGQEGNSEGYLLRRGSSGRETLTGVRRLSSASNNTKPVLQTNKKSDQLDLSAELHNAITESDKALLEEAKKMNDVAGSTALVALLDPVLGRLAVANVGDSRGILCDAKGTVIPLSFDHKPQQLKERRRIQEAGGFIAFNGVWRVAGILATSRALGDFPLKERKLLIAEPDVLSFDLKELKLQAPTFLILASDGLWDAFSNEEAAFYIRQRLHETHLGARSLAMQAYQRGSVDNITVLVVNLTNFC